MTLLVFGKTGQVATELHRLAPDAVFLGRDEADLSDPAACAAAIHAHAPSAVINAAAYTAVDRAEEDEALAATVNSASPAAMARVCTDKEVPFLHVSTDYVFDGAGDAPPRETDAASPLNAYGRTKLAGEEGVRAAGGAHVILRTSWVFSAHGTNFVKTMLRLSETRDTLSVVDDQVGGPTPAADIAAALLNIARRMTENRDGTIGGTYHFAGQPSVSWKEFAETIFDLAGREVTVHGIPTVKYPTPARRPLNSRLDCSKLTQDLDIDPPDWRRGLQKVLDELGASV